jgi:hypothetical protein
VPFSLLLLLLLRPKEIDWELALHLALLLGHSFLTSPIPCEPSSAATARNSSHALLLNFPSVSSSLLIFFNPSSSASSFLLLLDELLRSSPLPLVNAPTLRFDARYL